MDTGKRLRVAQMFLRALGWTWLGASAIAAPVLLAHLLWCGHLPQHAARGLAAREPAERSVSAAPAFAVTFGGEGEPARKSVEVAGTPAPVDLLVRPMFDAGIPGAVGSDEVSRAWAALGCAQLKMGRRQEAMLAFQRSIGLSDRPFDVIYDLTDEAPDLALWLLALGEAREQPKAEYLCGIARVLRWNDRDAEALALVQRAVALASDATNPLHELIFLDPDAAIPSAEAWIAAHPAATDEILHLAEELREVGRQEASVHLAMLAAFGAGGDEKRIAAALRVVKIAPGSVLPDLQRLAGEQVQNAVVLRCLAQAYDEAGFQADAAAALRRAIDIGEYPYDKADLRAYVKLDPRGAVEVLERLPREFPDDADNAGFQGLALQALGRADEARAAFLQALALQPFSDEWPAALARTDAGVAVVALHEQIRRLAGTYHEDEGWGNLGNVYEAIGRPQDALSAYRRAAELAPGDEEWTEAIARLMGGPEKKE